MGMGQNNSLIPACLCFALSAVRPLARDRAIPLPQLPRLKLSPAVETNGAVAVAIGVGVEF